MIERSEDIKEIATALSKFQGKVLTVIKGSSNPFFRSKYADLSAIMETIKPCMAENGLSIVQTLEPSDKIRMTTTVMHTSGQWLSSTFEMTPKDTTPQAAGSCITYARRYALSAMLGIVSDEDDDGNAASINEKKKETVKDDLPVIKIPNDIKVETFTRSDGVVINKKTNRPI